MKIYKCGLCRKKQYIGTRVGLRKHLKKEHFIVKEITNVKINGRDVKQKWWITEEK